MTRGLLRDAGYHDRADDDHGARRSVDAAVPNVRAVPYLRTRLGGSARVPTDHGTDLPGDALAVGDDHLLRGRAVTIPLWAFGISLAVGACGWWLFWREVVRQTQPTVTLRAGRPTPPLKVRE